MLGLRKVFWKNNLILQTLFLYHSTDCEPTFEVWLITDLVFSFSGKEKKIFSIQYGITVKSNGKENGTGKKSLNFAWGYLSSS